LVDDRWSVDDMPAHVLDPKEDKRDSLGLCPKSLASDNDGEPSG